MNRQQEILNEIEKKERDKRIEKHLKKRDLFVSLIAAIKSGNKLLTTELTNKVPKYKIKDFIWKLGRYKFKQYPLTKMAISQLRWRKGG